MSRWRPELTIAHAPASRLVDSAEDQDMRAAISPEMGFDLRLAFLF